MTRSPWFRSRPAATRAAIACAFCLVAADFTLADGGRSPGPDALVRPRTRARAGAARPIASPSAALIEGDPPAVGRGGTSQATRDPSIHRSTEGLVLQMLPDGSRRVHLQGRFRAYSAVAIGADGALRMACAADQGAALALAATAARPPATRPHRAPFGPGEE